MTLNFVWAVRSSLVILIIIIIILLIPAKYKGSQTLINFSHPNICLDNISDHEEENMDSDETEKMESPGEVPLGFLCRFQHMYRLSVNFIETLHVFKINVLVIIADLSMD